MNGQEDFIQYADAVRPAIHAAIEAHIASLFDDLPQEAGRAILESVAGGKCLRGSLLCLVGEAFGAQRHETLSRAVAIECIHAATLVHDDLIDRDRYRRGRPALWTVAGGREAVLLGDVILSDAIRMLAREGAADACIGGETISKLARGAYIESLFGDGQSSARAYARIIELKTGVLFSAAAELGAVSAGAAPALRERARRFGRLLGEAYQMADDLQDLESESLMPGLSPAIRHFLPECGQATTELSPEMKRMLRDRMRDAAIARCEMACLSLGDAEIMRYDRALRTAPEQAAGMQCPDITLTPARVSLPFGH